MRDDTLPLSHFESMYRRSEDPWGFATSDYERGKYAATLAAIPRARYEHALEVGCSIGVFTALLADRCGDLLAIEPVSSALAAARDRNKSRLHVRFAEMFVPADWPAESFDLVILSEVLDYLGHSDLLTLADRLRQSLLTGGDVVLVHWVGKKRPVLRTQDEASDVLIAATRDFAGVVHQIRNRDYRLDVLARA